jgi:hypothetical protein
MKPLPILFMLVLAGGCTTATSPSHESGESSELPSAAAPISIQAVATTTVNVRRGPGAVHPKVGRLEAGQSVERFSDDGSWSLVDYNGQQAWISSEFLVTGVEAEALKRARVERVAKYGVSGREALDAYSAVLKDLQRGTGVKIFDSLAVSGGTVKVTVTNLWHSRHRQVRLQDAQLLWEAWARIRAPSDPDSARILILDYRGNEVGGSRWLAGSLLWVLD